MITRAEYMSNAKELRQAYYLQFATPGTFRFVRECIGLELLRTSKDKYFNDVIHMPSLGGWIWDRAPINQTLIKQAGDTITKSTITCVAKSAAVELLRREA
jgi:hypothetical protein